MVIGQPDEFPDAHVQLVTDDGQLVGVGDIDVAEGVLGQFAHFRGAGIGGQNFPGNEVAVELGGSAGGRLVDAPDDTVVFHQFFHDLPRQHAFRAVGHKETGTTVTAVQGFPLGEIGALLGQPGGDLFSGADGAGGFEDDQVALLQHRCDRPARRFDVA